MPEIKNICLGGAAALAIALAAAPAVAWEPNKPVEIVVAAGAGGASDQMARMMQAAIQKNGLMKQPMVVSLKGGASGAEALIYMKSSDGDPHKVLIAYSLIYMLPLSAKIPVQLARPHAGLGDRARSVRAVDEYAAAVQKREGVRRRRQGRLPPFKMGGTGSRREDHVLTVFLEKQTGAKFAYLPYKSGARPPPSSSAITPPPTSTIRRRTSKSGAPARCGRCACSTRSGSNIRPRSPPTCRGTTCPPARSRARHSISDAARHVPARQGDAPDQAAFYVDLFKKLTQTAEYKEYMEKQALKPTFLTGKDMVKFLEEDDALNKNLMTEAGFVAISTDGHTRD